MAFKFNDVRIQLLRGAHNQAEQKPRKGSWTFNVPRNFFSQKFRLEVDWLREKEIIQYLNFRMSFTSAFVFPREIYT